MNCKYTFDSETGTMILLPEAKPLPTRTDKGLDDAVRSSDAVPTKPVFANERKLEAGTPGHVESPVLQMRRSDKKTEVQLIGEDGIPEAYLDTSGSGVVMFHELQDYDVAQITEEKTGKVLACVGGYALKFSFNMEELDTPERVDECLQGIVKLFRHQIMTQAVRKKA